VLLLLPRHLKHLQSLYPASPLTSRDESSYNTNHWQPLQPLAVTQHLGTGQLHSHSSVVPLRMCAMFEV
jgi:hypothetical protein